MNNLVIVAHPDDETIWMGGKILQESNKNWTIISLSRKEDQDRQPKFKKVCKKLKANGIISDLDDEKLEPLDQKEIIDKIKSLVPNKKYENIYTHGNNGEYGHLRHKEIHRAVKKLIKDNILACKKFFSFSYKLSNKKVPDKPQLRIPVPKKNADEYIELTEDNFKKKVSLVKNMYGFPGESFEVLSCNKNEAFKLY
jgi:LmbE family N-acetylglucosaminyl deacetylase